MKKLVFMALLGIMMEKNEEPVGGPPPTTCGQFMALRNGTEWIAAPTASFASIGQDTVNVLIEQCQRFGKAKTIAWLGLNRLPLQPNTYPLTSVCWATTAGTPLSAWFYSARHDGLGSRHYRLETADSTNALTITSYDPATRIVRGQLHATFVPEHPGQEKADTIRIREASFTARVRL